MPNRDSDSDANRNSEAGPDADPAEYRSPARVRETYDEIATHFAKTREYPWPEIEAFLESVPAGEWGLDVGCGNGRHLPGLAARTDCVLGVDVSGGLLATARERLGATPRAASLVQGDARALPVAGGTVDVALYVATIHHLPDTDQRRGSLDELARVLSPEGVALVSAWSTTHDRFEVPADDTGFDTTVDWTLPDGETVPRFYHIYAPAEFEADLAASALTVERTEVSSGNCYARVRA